MSAELDDTPAASLFERLVGRQHRPWILVGASLFLILAPIGAAYLDGVLGQLFSGGFWRIALLPSAVIIYILAVAPILERTGVRVVEAFRPLVLIDDDDFDRLVDQASHLNPIGEVVAFGVGAAFGLWVGFVGLSDEGLSWLRLCLMLISSLMFGLLAWTIYSAVAGTRLTAELHRQPLHVDILDPKPFEPIGRQSLSIALAFVGGILLSVLFGLGLCVAAQQE
jgi:MFS family permease